MEGTTNPQTAWAGFRPGRWQRDIDVSDFILQNWTPYAGDESFLAPPTARTRRLLSIYEDLLSREAQGGGVLDIDTHTVSSVLSHAPGYLDQEAELIVGLQTDAPLRRAVNPFGGIRMAEQACEQYGYHLSDEVREAFRYRTTHNDGVFRVYTDEMRAARRCGIITGLPDAYGRGRLIGDYRRVALYGLDALIAAKRADKEALGKKPMDQANLQLMEEVYKQIDFLEKLGEMARMYGRDISSPAANALEATQAVYFAYLAAIKEQNGAAMSLSRVSTFLDIYFERDLASGLLDESGAQEIFDDFVLKLRLARQLRTPSYNQLFAGDPTWVTEAVGGMAQDGRTLVTRSSLRVLHTLENLGSAPEPNLTVLWSRDLPAPFKRYCARLSIETDALQYENDDLMRSRFGDDYAIACCVSAAKVGKQMQFFGARANLPKLLLFALNGGRDEISGEQVGPVTEPVGEGPLEFWDVLARYRHYLAWLARLYADTMNVIHFMHDKYAYEKIQMALHDTQVERFMSFGLAGLSVATDSLSAIRYAKVTPVRGEGGLIQDFILEGEYPAFGNDDDRVDGLACLLCDEFIGELRKQTLYRDATATLSVLTITSNVVYGKKTGPTPDGRKAGQPFAPGANPLHGRDHSGALASLNSVAKLSYDALRDGISNTLSLTPAALGSGEGERAAHLCDLLDGYFAQGAHHLNVNVLSRQLLEDAMEHPEDYPGLTVRVSGYAVHFARLSPEQQREVIARTFHESA